MKINPQTKEEIRKLLKEKVALEKRKVTVYSASELTQEQKSLLSKKMGFSTGQKIEYTIKPSLIAGIMVQVGSRMIDESVQGKLQNLHSLIYDAV